MVLNGYVSMYAIGHYMCPVSLAKHLLLLICSYKNLIKINILSNIQFCQVWSQVGFEPTPLTFWMSALTTRPLTPPIPWHRHPRAYAG